MRNIFAQFQHPENQLTHALASVLALNPKLCRRFLKDMAGITVPARERLVVTQQHIPGTADPIDEDDERSLPDACISGTGTWCLAIESKITAPLKSDQLKCHQDMVERAFDTVTVLAITAEATPSGLIPTVCHTTWPQVFTWLRRHCALAPQWADHLREYMRLLESRLLSEGCSMPGPLTTFDGIPFDDEHPYAYIEAKMLLDQMLALLRKRPALKKLGVDPHDEGRPAITGRKRLAVWDFLSLRPYGGGKIFTAWPHLTLGIHHDKVDVMVTIPNGINRAARNRLIALGRDGFLGLAATMGNRMMRALGSKGFQPVLVMEQRHFHARRNAISDGRLIVDLRTITGYRKAGVKQQQNWVRSAYDIFTDKQGTNLQLQFGAWLPHQSGLLHGAEAIQHTEALWLSCAPLIQLLLQSADE